MTSSLSRRVGVVQGSQLTATGPEPSSGVGPAFHLDEPTLPLRSYLELGALPTAVPCAGCMPGTCCGSGTSPLIERAGPRQRSARQRAGDQRREGYGGTRRGGCPPAVVGRQRPRPHRSLGRRPAGASTERPRRTRNTRPSGRGRTRAVPGGGAERALGLVPDPGACGQGCLVRDRGVIARAARSGGGGGNHRSFG